jgi:FAD/FMN-containing dehydrogenase
MATIAEQQLDEALIKPFRSCLRGTLMKPGDDGYDAARRVWNGRIDRKPALIVPCVGVADVIQAVKFARVNNLEISVRGSGHNVTGNAVCDGGITIDLSAMRGVRVDPQLRTVRAQAGVTWGEFDHETQAFGLATTGARISTTGIAGVTLGGGYGWLMRKYGLAIDNLRSVDVVTADGGFITVSDGENADLFWGIRGGGGNFGIVTSFEYQLHPVGPMITGGMAFYPAVEAKELLYRYREFMATACDELTALFNFFSTLPPAPFVPSHLRGVPVVAIAVCHIGSIEDGRRELAPLREFAQPLIDRIRPMPYTTLQRLFDAAGVFGCQVHSQSGHLVELSDNAIETLVTHAAHITSPLSIVMISSLGGAVGRVGENDTAFSHRHVRYDYAIDSVWTDHRESRPHMQWTDDFGKAMRVFSSGTYVNELGDEGEERVRAAYNPTTYAQLVALKNKYDPGNLFHLNQNIKPTVR